jgi:tetratricopeptide (TPR) repeat protein
MDFNLIQKKYKNCCHLVIEKQLCLVFSNLQELIAETHGTDYKSQLDEYRNIYTNMLKYSFGEFEDPEKKHIYFKLLQNLLDFSDTVYEHLLVSNSNLYLSKIRQNPSYIKEINNDDLKPDKLFFHYWLTRKYNTISIDIASSIITKPEFSWWEKCLLVSAITLSLEYFFDESKFLLLAEAYRNGEQQVKQRALVGLMINLYLHQKRVKLYPKIEEGIAKLHEIPDFEKQVEAILIQFIRTKDTEKINKKFQEEIFPEMARIQSRIYDKLNMKDLIQDPLQDDKNPDWENVFHDSPNLLNKLEEFSVLQMEGSDVFLSTFSMLKNFTFFDHIENWFMPFYKENPDLAEALKDETGQFDSISFSENMEHSSILCNSDKYSFSLNIQHVPAKERSMVVEMFNMEVKSMDEIASDDDLLNKPSRENNIYKQYIQDIYRFNKLFPHKQNFFDIFSAGAVFHNAHTFRWLIRDEKIIRNIGEFLFEKGYYKDTIEVFSLIDNCSDNFELWQKIAYSWQQLGDYSKALEYYLKADLMEIRKAWNIKKIALCYRRLGDYEKALHYYLEAEKMEPDNIQLQANIAHTFFDQKDYDNALKVYFKVEYLTPDNHKIQRPIAWCSLMMQKPQTAKKYFEKIIDKEGNQHDLLNLGHVEWCMGNKKVAIERYHQSLKASENNINWFTEEFMADSEILIRYGIDPLDIPLMRDLIILQEESQ